MSTLTGTGHLLRLIGRLERLRLTVWVLILGLMPIFVASAFQSLYDTEASRLELVRTVGSSAGLVALLGPVKGSSIGALTAWRIGTIGAVFVAVMAAFTVIRHTRLDEETGRRELLGAAVVGRHAPLVAASIAAVAAAAAIAVLIIAGLSGVGEPLAGASAFGVSWFLTAIVFAAIGALAAQLTESAGSARGIVAAVIGVLFALRMSGDGGASNSVGWLSWLSPIGWVTKFEPFAGQRWPVAVLFVMLAGAIGWIAFAISANRDVAAGVFPPRPGPADAAPGLRSPFGLAWRMQKAGVIGWIVGISIFAAVWGGLGNTITDLFDENPQLADLFEALGGTGTLTELFFSAAMAIMALIVASYAISTASTLRSEEEGLRAEHILATPTPRLRWAASHLVYSLCGPVVLMAIAGVASGLVHGTIDGDLGHWVPTLLGSALLQVPAIWIAVGVAVALYGLAPRQTTLAWGALVVFLLLGQLGPILQLPQWAMNFSPFTHIPTPPGPVSILPLAVLTVTAAMLWTVGLGGFQRRDLL